MHFMSQILYNLGKIASVKNIGTTQNNKRDQFMPGKHLEMMDPSKC